MCLHGTPRWCLYLMATVLYVEYYKFCRRRSSVQLFDKVVVNKVLY